MLDKDSDVSRIVDRLVQKGLASWVENPEDRRQKSVNITAPGLALLEKNTLPTLSTRRNKKNRS